MCWSQASDLSSLEPSRPQQLTPSASSHIHQEEKENRFPTPRSSRGVGNGHGGGGERLYHLFLLSSTSQTQMEHVQTHTTLEAVPRMKPSVLVPTQVSFCQAITAYHSCLHLESAAQGKDISLAFQELRGESGVTQCPMTHFTQGTCWGIYTAGTAEHI